MQEQYEGAGRTLDSRTILFEELASEFGSSFLLRLWTSDPKHRKTVQRGLAYMAPSSALWRLYLADPRDRPQLAQSIRVSKTVHNGSEILVNA